MTDYDEAELFWYELLRGLNDDSAQIKKPSTIRDRLNVLVSEEYASSAHTMSLDEAISFEIWVAEQNGEITHEEGNALYAEYTEGG